MKNGRSETKQVADAATQWTNDEDGVIGALQPLEALVARQGPLFHGGCGGIQCSAAHSSNVLLPTRCLLGDH
jgi:hypothetical protein